MDYAQIPLKPMQLPDAIGWWPLAPGWWLLLLLVFMLTGLLFWWLRRRKADRRRFCLAEFEQIKHRFKQSQDETVLLTDCSALLKRSALTLFPREQVAALSGERWLTFLLENSKGCDESQLRCLVDGPYQPQVKVPAEALLAGCKQWLKTAGKGKRTDV
ncbi:MAG: DUF4381 domain-containing protein [Pontibacterium sp.]